MPVKITVLSEKDSTSVVEASLYYEKLPYYDDLGTSKTDARGQGQFFLVKGIAYSLKITAAKFQEKIQEVTVMDDDGDGNVAFTFYITPMADEEPEVFVLNNLIFDRGSEQISGESYSSLDELAAWINGRPSMIIQLEGHTDFAGNPDANMRLSEARVLAVKDYLVKKGIRKERILTKAFGGSQPLSTERTEEAKAANRRVEVRVISK